MKQYLISFVVLFLSLLAPNALAFDLTPSLLDRLEAYDSLTSKEFIDVACLELVAGLRADTIALAQPVECLPNETAEERAVAATERATAVELLLRANSVYEAKCR